MGDQPLVQLTGEHRDAVHPYVVSEPVACHADLATAGFQQHLAIEVSQRCKGKAVQYISHLIAVSGLVWEDGGTEDQAIAGLLHDAIEDAGQSHGSIAERERRSRHRARLHRHQRGGTGRREVAVAAAQDPLPRRAGAQAGGLPVSERRR